MTFFEFLHTDTFYVLAALVVALCLVLMLCSGCDYAFIHKKQITEFHTHFKAYRGFVTVKDEFKDKAALIEEGADNLEATLKAWKGEK